MTGPPTYEVVVVGGGPAGLTTATYTARLGHRTALIDGEGGRHEAVARIHNLIGVSPETSGAELAELAIEQVIAYGVDHYGDTVTDVQPAGCDPLRFDVRAERADLTAERVVLATGFSDEPPRVPGLREFTGRGLYYCLHCDAYAVGDGRAFVLGHDDHAAETAMFLLNVTPDVDLLLNGADPEWGEETAEQVRAHPVDVVEQPVEGTVPEAPSGAADRLDGEAADRLDGEAADRLDGEAADRLDGEAVDQVDSEDDRPSGGDDHTHSGGGDLQGLVFADGSVREYAGGFAVYGREYENRLARDLGCDLHDDGAVAVDEARRTSVEGVYAAGDLTHGQNQTTIALGDGAYAGIALHKDLRTFPVASEDLPDVPEPPAVADDLRARMRRVGERGMTVGMTPSSDDD